MFITYYNNCTSFVKISLVPAFRKAALNFNPFILRVIMESQCKVVLTSELVDKMMWHYHSETSLEELSQSVIWFLELKFYFGHFFE